MYISTKLIPTRTDKTFFARMSCRAVSCRVVWCRYGAWRIGVNYRIQLYGYNIWSCRTNVNRAQSICVTNKTYITLIYGHQNVKLTKRLYL
jgi:hypothetical protein